MFCCLCTERFNDSCSSTKIENFHRSLSFSYTHSSKFFEFKYLGCFLWKRLQTNIHNAPSLYTPSRSFCLPGDIVRKGKKTEEKKQSVFAEVSMVMIYFQKISWAPEHFIKFSPEKIICDVVDAFILRNLPYQLNFKALMRVETRRSS